MRAHKLFYILLILLLAATLPIGCRTRSNAFVIALSDNVRTIDPIGAPAVEAAPERVRTLMFNSLVKKDEKFDYVPELATKIDRSPDGLTYTFTLHEGVKFHDGKPLTSADAKYTLDTLLSNNFAKAASFFEGTGANKQSYVKSVEAPDERTLVVRLTKPWLGLLSNLVPIPIIPKDSYSTQKDHPLGSGPFKFVRFDSAQQVIDMEANPNYWEGPPHISALRLRVISDMNALQAELKSGRVDLAPLPTSLNPDAVRSLSQDPNLKVEQFTGSNVAHLTFNTEAAPLNDVRVRQAIAYAIDREGLIRDLLLGQGKIAHSILPENSWAYTTGQKYSFDPDKAKQLLDAAGFRDPDGDGPQMRFPKPMTLKISASSTAARQYAGVMQNQLQRVGIPVAVETVEFTTMQDQLKTGQFQIQHGNWVGGNQDPIFYKDLFASTEVPTQERVGRNRSRYRNKELDTLIEEAVSTVDREKALGLYTRIQDIISRDLPLFSLWYQANIIVAKRNVGNIKINASGDWGFVRNLTVDKQ